jgi:hypothetical protein
MPSLRRQQAEVNAMLQHWLDAFAVNAETINAKHLDAMLGASRNVFRGVGWPQQLEAVPVDSSVGELFFQVLNSSHLFPLALFDRRIGYPIRIVSIADLHDVSRHIISNHVVAVRQKIGGGWVARCSIRCRPNRMRIVQQIVDVMDCPAATRHLPLDFPANVSRQVSLLQLYPLRRTLSPFSRVSRIF